MNDTPNTAPTPETDAFIAAQEYPRVYRDFEVPGQCLDFARTLERQRNKALADNAKLQAALDEAQAACVAKDKAITNLQRLFGHHQMWPSLEISEARSSTCSQPILARLKAMEDALHEIYMEAEGDVDGAPDASLISKFANIIVSYIPEHLRK